MAEEDGHTYHAVILQQVIDAVRDDLNLIDELQSCRGAVVATLKDALAFIVRSGSHVDPTQLDHVWQSLCSVADTAHGHMRSVHHTQVETHWRRAFTDAMLLKAMLVALQTDDGGTATQQQHVLDAIRDLDLAIIIAGAPGYRRHDQILTMIALLQESILDCDLPTVQSSWTGVLSPGLERTEEQFQGARAILTLQQMPDMESFLVRYSGQPFIVRGGARHWPAFDEASSSGQGKWAEKHYLRSVAGPGRVVPIEIGRQYTDEDWTQDILPWHQFLDQIGWGQAPKPSSPGSAPKSPPLYLAQYNIFDQFPALRDDILLPDLLYACPSAPAHCPEYRPPIDQHDGTDNVLLNAWLGPVQTISPVHRDPYFNLFHQVVGHKLVWLAPPDTNDDEKGNGADLWHGADVFATDATTTTAETGRLDVGASTAVLAPGDVLYMPPGWYHALKSLTNSFSVSMWF